jgi:hypothetical protein
MEERNENVQAYRSGRCTLREYLSVEMGIVQEAVQVINSLPLTLNGEEERLVRAHLLSKFQGGVYAI